MSRRIRESRQELRKFMRETKKTNPAAQCSLQGDKLYIDHKCYVWSDTQAKVVEHTLSEEAPARSVSPCRFGLTPPPPSNEINGLDEEKEQRIFELEQTVRRLQGLLQEA